MTSPMLRRFDDLYQYVAYQWPPGSDAWEVGYVPTYEGHRPHRAYLSLWSLPTPGTGSVKLAEVDALYFQNVWQALEFLVTMPLCPQQIEPLAHRIKPEGANVRRKELCDCL